VLQLRETDGKPAVEIRNSFGTRNATRRFYFDDRFMPAAGFTLGDPDGNIVPDLGVFSTRRSDARAAHEIRNSRGDANTRRFFFGP
jgi:hypothetical protein